MKPKKKPERKIKVINDDLIINAIIESLKKDPKMYKKYISDCLTRKYELKIQLTIIIKVLRLGISWRDINELTIAQNIHWNTVYKTFRRLIDDLIIDKCFNDTVNRYVKNKPASKLKVRMTDTTVIPNKLGEEDIGRNIHYNGKNITKISLITDLNGNPLDANIYSGNKYDSAIYHEQIDEKSAIETKLEEKYRRILLADKGYDSMKLRNKLIEKGFIPIIPYNRRNTKDPEKIKHLTEKEKMIYKQRIRIEQTFMKLKRNKRINIRYEISDMIGNLIFIKDF